MTRAVLYARVSGNDYAKTGGENLQDQIRLCREHAIKRDYNVVSELAEDDHGASGATFDLPQLSKALEMARAGQFDVLIVRELDRLSRDLAKQLIIEQELTKASVTIEYVLYDFPDTPEGRLNKNLRAMLAEYEREKIKQRMTSGRRRKVKNGEVMTHGRPPLGYKGALKDGKRILEIEESEAAIVSLIFGLYTTGDGENGPLAMNAIRQRLDQLNIPTYSEMRNDIRTRTARIKKQGSWSNSSVAKIINTETYSGTWHYCKTGDSDPIPVKVPAIIDLETWETACELRKHNQQNALRSTKHNYLLGRMLTCGECHYHVRSIAIKKKHRKTQYYYRCGARSHDVKCSSSTHYRVDDVDRTAWESIREKLYDEKSLLTALRDQQSRRNEILEPKRRELEIVKQLITENENQLDKLIDLYLRGDFPKEMLTERKQRLEQTLDGLRGEQVRILELIKEQELNDESIQSIMDFRSAVGNGILEADRDFAKRRWLFEKLNVSGELNVEDGQKVLYLHCDIGNERLLAASINSLYGRQIIRGHSPRVPSHYKLLSPVQFSRDDHRPTPTIVR